ncbi:MAG: TraB/GumN family protein [Desulfobacterales bacterium]
MKKYWEEIIHINGREIILVGTAHVSKESVEQVARVIEAQKPDTVCVEPARPGFSLSRRKISGWKWILSRSLKRKIISVAVESHAGVLSRNASAIASGSNPERK